MEEAEKARREAEAEKAQRDMEAEEAQRTAEVEEARRKAEEEERVQKEAEKQKKMEALVAQHKQLELLSQCKVAACIAWEEDARRALPVEKQHRVGLWGNGKRNAPEKHVCMNCLRKGVKCEWDEGG